MHIDQEKARQWIALALQLTAHVFRFFHKRKHTWLLNWLSAGFLVVELGLAFAIQFGPNDTVVRLVFSLNTALVTHIVFTKVNRKACLGG